MKVIGFMLAAALVPVAVMGGDKGQVIPFGVNEYDYVVYKPEQPFDGRNYGDKTKRGDSYNDHFQVIWDAKRSILFAFWTQASWEGAPDSHIAFSKSFDKGRTWTRPVLLAGSETRQYPRQDAYYQQPMLSKSGRLYCLWTERLTNHGMVGSYSDDAGENWAQPKVMTVRRMDQDPSDYRIAPNYINWQRPLRIGSGGRFFVASSRHGKAPYDEKDGCKIEFWEFLNLDDDPPVNGLKLDYFATNRDSLGVDKLPKGNYFQPKFYPGRNPPVPEGPAVEEASLVKLPDGRLFAMMRSSIGHPVWSQSRDGGRTWSGLKPLVDGNGKAFLHSRSPCPIYDRGGDAAASGEYFAFVHNKFDFKAQTACQYPRSELYLIAGKFDPDGEQPIRFSAPKLFMKRHYGNSLYSSYTVIDGEGILWFPDVKYYLLGRKVGPEWFK